jgi:predicted RNase H-like HicB family nuclease
MLKSGIWPKMAPRQMEEHTMVRPIVIHADWDPEAGVWVATTQDLRGLVTEAETMEALRAKLPGIILDLLEEKRTESLIAPLRSRLSLVPAIHSFQLSNRCKWPITIGMWSEFSKTMDTSSSGKGEETMKYGGIAKLMYM